MKKVSSGQYATTIAYKFFFFFFASKDFLSVFNQLIELNKENDKQIRVSEDLII